MWKTVQLRLDEKRKPIFEWESELSLALANMRLLPSRSLGYKSPHEKFTLFSRRSTLEPAVSLPNQTNDVKLPSWLKSGSLAYMKIPSTLGISKPLQEVLVKEILSACHAHVYFSKSGRTDTVSIHHLSRHPLCENGNDCQIDNSAVLDLNNNIETVESVQP